MEDSIGGKFNLMFLILTFGDIQNPTALHSLAQPCLVSGADLDLADMAGPPPGRQRPRQPLHSALSRPAHLCFTSPSLSHPRSLWTEPCLCQLCVSSSSMLCSALLGLLWKALHLFTPQALAGPLLSAGAARQQGCRGDGAASGGLRQVNWGSHTMGQGP